MNVKESYFVPGLSPAVSIFTRPFLSPLLIWRHRALIVRLSRSEIISRYRGSLLGMVWLILTPLLMLSVYSFVFTVIFPGRWSMPEGRHGAFVPLLYSGMIIFAVFSDCVNRAPSLMLENISYLKKIVFPLEILPVVSLLSALFGAAIGFGVLLIFYLATIGLPPVTAVLLPFVLLPLILFTLGLSWFIASVGVFIRDLRQFVGVATTALMFLSPVFYPITAVPVAIRPYVLLNPLGLILEQSKDVLFWGRVPDPVVWLGSVVICWLIAWLGYAWFMKTRKGFADVT